MAVTINAAGMPPAMTLSIRFAVAWSTDAPAVFNGVKLAANWLSDKAHDQQSCVICISMFGRMSLVVWLIMAGTLAMKPRMPLDGSAADIASPSAGRKTCRVIDLGACGRSACRRTRTAIVLDHGECLGGQYDHCHQNDEQNNEQHVPSRFHPDREAGLHLS